jgi:nicotinate-nucleotide adenylyltransferase
MGLFGGAFDPPHQAHHALAKAAIAQFALDTLWVLPTGQAWHKARPLSSAEHRVAMTRLAFADMPQVQVDARETLRSGATFTVDTLLELQQAHAGAQWWLFIGEDQAQRFTTWHRWQDIVSMAQLVVAQRPASPADEPARRQWQNAMQTPVITLDLPAMDISATQIRQRLAMGQDASDCLQPQVQDYIRQHHLYTDQHE